MHTHVHKPSLTWTAIIKFHVTAETELQHNTDIFRTENILRKKNIWKAKQAEILKKKNTGETFQVIEVNSVSAVSQNMTDTGVIVHFEVR